MSCHSAHMLAHQLSASLRAVQSPACLLLDKSKMGCMLWLQACLPAVRASWAARGQRTTSEVLHAMLRPLLPCNLRGGMPADALGHGAPDLPLRPPLLLPLRLVGRFCGHGPVQPLPSRIPCQARMLCRAHDNTAKPFSRLLGAHKKACWCRCKPLEAVVLSKKLIICPRHP